MGVCLIHQENGSVIIGDGVICVFPIIFFRMFLSVLCNCGGLFVLLFYLHVLKKGCNSWCGKIMLIYLLSKIQVASTIFNINQTYL